MTIKHGFVMALLVALFGAAWVTLGSGTRNKVDSSAIVARETSQDDPPRSAEPAPPTPEPANREAVVETGASTSPRVKVRIEGVIAVRGGTSPGRLARMSVLALSSSGVGAAGHIADGGTFLVELLVPAADVSSPFQVALDTEAGQRLRQNIPMRSATPDDDLESGYIGQVTFEISNRFVVKGLAVDDEGRRLPGVDVALFSSPEEGEAVEVVTSQVTGKDGRFWLEVAPRGELLLVLAEKERRPHGQRLVALGGELDVGSVALSLGETISGFLVANEAESAAAELRVLAHRRSKRDLLLGDQFLELAGDTVGRVYAQAPIEEGRFVLRGLDPGEYTLQITRKEGVARLPGLVNKAPAVRAPSEDVELTCAESQFWFRLLDARTKGAVFARIRMQGDLGEFTFPTDRQGTVLVLAAPDSEYRATINAPGYEHAELDLRSSSSGGFQLIPVELEPIEPGQLMLVLDRPWTGRGRVELLLQGDDRNDSIFVDVVEGRVELRTLRPGIYTGTFELFGAGDLRGLDRDAEIELGFEVRIRPGETAEQRVPLN